MMLEQPNNTWTGLEVAIIGMEGVFPGAENINEFWDNLCNGVESIKHFSVDELKAAGVPAEVYESPNYIPASGVLSSIKGFDAGFFGYTPREAELLDPQARLFLECSWKALEGAGYAHKGYAGRIGIFGSSSINTYLLENIHPNRDVRKRNDDFNIFLKNGSDFLVTRIAHKLNLTGPAITVQTACSSSLVAIHLAVRSLLSGESDIVLAGGVSIRIPHYTGYLYQEGAIFSPDGHCRPFDALANGTVNGNGAGVVVLKRLEDALQANDDIYAVIKGSAINNDGSEKIGYTAPSVEGQVEVIVSALEVAEVSPASIRYIETHGTGTKLGDPIEVEALGQVFGNDDARSEPCLLSSVKSNMGHLDAAAGVASVIKAALALRYKKVPGTLHFQQPHPDIPWEALPFSVSASTQSLVDSQTPLRAGVSSFGMGGTNAHIILEEPPVVMSTPGRLWQLVVLSAKNKIALDLYKEQLGSYIEGLDQTALADIAYSLQVGRQAFNHRLAAVYYDPDNAKTVLETMPVQWLHIDEALKDPYVVFMFPGQGSQYVDMAKDIYAREPVFRQYVNHCCELIEPYVEYDIHSLIYPIEGVTEETSKWLQSTEVAQVALFIIEYALAQLLMEWSIQPQCYVGHSIGEYVAACLAGVFTLPQALRIVAMRGKLMGQQPPGGMLAVMASEEIVQKYINDTLSLAAVNEPNTCVVAGFLEAIKSLENLLDQDEVGYRRLHTSHAFHSAMMDPIIDEFADYMQTIHLNPPSMPFLSNKSGTWIRESEATNPWYWAQHIRQPVRFSENIAELLNQANIVFIEVGPGQTLSTFVKRQPIQASHKIITTMRHPRETLDDQAVLMSAVGNIWSVGYDIDWNMFYTSQQRKRTYAPTYPFVHQDYWIDLLEHTYLQNDNEQWQKQKLDSWFYLPTWDNTILPISNLPDDNLTWLIFANKDYNPLENYFEQFYDQVIYVYKGSEYIQTGSYTYTIDPSNYEHYELLLNELNAKNLIPSHILHTWTWLDSATYNHTDVILTDGFYSLLFFARALGYLDVEDQVQLRVVTNNCYSLNYMESLIPSKSTLIGPCHVLSQEYSRLSVKLIDIPWSPLPSDWTCLQLIRECIHSDATNRIVAYRGYERFVQSFNQVSLPEPALLPFRHKGVYLITGGLGGIGLEIAEYLAREYQANLVLVGRSQFPEPEDWDEIVHDTSSSMLQNRQTIKRLRNMQEIGAKSIVLSVDVTNLQAMEQALAKVHANFGTVHGVIHAAGVAGGGIAHIKQQESIEAVFAPKIKGTEVLAHIFNDYKLDFMLLCSSSIAVTGGFGRIDYCSANAFLDSFATYHSRLSTQRIISVNWDTWKDTGMAVNTSLPQSLSASKHISSYPLVTQIKDGATATFITIFDKQVHWILKEHQILGHAIVPGTALIEIMNVAAQHVLQQEAVELLDITFLQPVSVKQSLEVTTTFELINNIYHIEIFSGELVYAQAKAIKPDVGEKTTAIQSLLDGAVQLDITGRGGDRGNKDLYLGPRWQSLRAAYELKHGLLAEFSLSDSYSEDFEQHHLHPALLDEAVGFAGQQQVDANYLPFSYNSMIIIKPLSNNIYSYASKINYDDSELISVDLIIMNDKGEHLIEINGYTLKRVDSNAIQRIRFLDNNNVHHSAHSSGNNDIHQLLTDVDAMSSTEGIEVFKRILGHIYAPQIVISTHNLDERIKQINSFTQDRIIEEIGHETIGKLHPRPLLKTPYVQPSNNIEAQLADVWQHHLGIDAIGIHDNFFELGGDSLLSIQILSTLKQKSIRITTQDMFDHPTIAELALIAKVSQIAQAEQGLIQGMVPLTPIQHWFVKQELKEPHFWNQSLLLELPTRLSYTHLQQAIEYICEHHDILRASYTLTNSAWVQSIHAAISAQSTVFEVIQDLSHQSWEYVYERLTQIQSGLNLETGNLVKFVYIERDNEHDLMAGIVHHLIIDISGWRTILEDLETVYQQLESNQAPKLPAKTTSFKQWSEYLNKHTETEDIQKDFQYWKQWEYIAIPKDDPHAANVESSTQVITKNLTLELTTMLLQDIAHVYQTTTQHVLLAALALTISDWLDQKKIALDVEGNSRDIVFDDMDFTRTVGWFTTIYPINIHINHHKDDLASIIKSVKEQLRSVPEQGLSFGMLRYLCFDNNVKKALSSQPSPDISFLYLGELAISTINQRLWSLSSASPGVDHHPQADRSHQIEINVLIEDGVLKWRWMYSSNVYKVSTIDQLANACLINLQALIEHCLDPQAGGYTPSDFEAVDISQDDLDSLIDELDMLLEG